MWQSLQTNLVANWGVVCKKVQIGVNLGQGQPLVPYLELTWLSLVLPLGDDGVFVSDYFRALWVSCCILEL